MDPRPAIAEPVRHDLHTCSKRSVILVATLAIRSTAADLLSRVSLRTALRLDGAVSGANGVAYLLAAGTLGDLLGLSPDLLRLLGGVLVAFAAVVLLTAARPSIPRPAVLAIVAVNALWAVASIAAAIGGLDSPTAAGTIWIVAQAIVVAAFAELQISTLARER